jgi:hypothetical protein
MRLPEGNAAIGGDRDQRKDECEHGAGSPQKQAAFEAAAIRESVGIE